MFTQTTIATFIAAQTLFLLFFLTPVTTQAQTSTAARSSFHVNRGQARYASGKWEQAIADFDTALIIDPRNAAIFNARGLVWLALKDYGLAIRDFNQAIKLAPDFATAYANRGLARLQQGRESKASEDFARSFELDESSRAYVVDLKGNNAQQVSAHR
ncbi:MAG: tetratricopeptide repeat protein [Acidobacteriota bacterium]